jgi:hypothetical protein
MSERRMQLLFLKRLENDGIKIIISKQDRDLLRNFGKLEESQAEKDLMVAMESDGLITLKGEDEEVNSSLRQTRSTLRTNMKSASSVGKHGGRFSMLKKVSAILAQSEAPLPELPQKEGSPPQMSQHESKVNIASKRSLKRIDSGSVRDSLPRPILQ